MPVQQQHVAEREERKLGLGPQRGRLARRERLARTAKRLRGAESSLKQLENLSSTTPALEEGRFHPPRSQRSITETAMTYV